VWDECDELHPLVRTNLVAAGYQRPTLLQRHAVPVVAAGHDLLVIASMHCPESLLAFLAPLISDLIHTAPATASSPAAQRHQREDQSMTPQAVIVAPHAKLASQILAEVRGLTHGSSLRSDLQQQEDGGRRHEHADVLVSAPDRLIDAIDRGQVSLRQTRFVLFYAVDRQLDAGLASCIHRIAESDAGSRTGDARRVWLFSSTLPQGVRELASQLLSEARRLKVFVGRMGPSEAISQTLVCVDDERDKPRVVSELLRGQQQQQQITVVFVQTKRGVDQLAAILERECDAPVVAVHGDTPRLDRESRMESFLSGAAPVLVATAVAVRGSLHNDGARKLHVISYDMPSHIDEYVYRIGHARRGGRTTVLVSPARDSAVLPELAELLRESNLEVPEWLERVSPSAPAAKTVAWTRHTPRQ
jgi:ATP-dependent RNA helicase DDX3X